MKIITATFLLLTLTACSTQNFKVSKGDFKSIPSYEGTSHFVFWGIGQEKFVNPHEVCGDKDVAQIATKTSFLNGFLGAITWGIYSPRDYVVYCEDKK
jgi:hypothetical protein